MQKYFNYFLDERGEPIRSASVHVKTSAGATATIYTSAGAATTNPFSTNTTGYFEFYVPNGLYTVVLSKSGHTTVTIDSILIDDPTVATIAALKAAGLPTTANARITVLGYTSAGDGGGGDFYWVTGDQSANVTADTQSGIWVAPTSAPTGASGAWKRVYSGAIKAKWYGVVGDGVTNDYAALNAWFAALDNKDGDLEDCDCYVGSLLTISPTNTTIRGVPGKTRISGDFGYAVIKFLDISNVHFYGIEFKTTYTSAVEDLGAAVVYSYQESVTNCSFRHCKFSAPNANTNGLVFYARINAADTSGVIQGLWVEDCDFSSIGRIACTLMNRGTASDKYTAASRVYFNRNKGSDLGINGSYGFLISLDGYGSEFSVDYNYIEKALGIGIENTGWINGSISHNQFDDFSRGYNPITTSDRATTGLSIVGNSTLTTASAHVSINLVNKSVIRDNYISGSGTYGVLIRDSSDNLFSGNYFACTGSYAALVEAATTNCKRNKSVGDIFDTSGSAANTAVVRFSGASCSENQIIRPSIRKGTGGAYYEEATSAANNLVTAADNGSTDVLFSNSASFNFSSDADYTLLLYHYSADFITASDSGVVLTTSRNVILPIHKKIWVVRNATAQTLTFKTASGNGVAVKAGTKETIIGDGTNIQRAKPEYPGVSADKGDAAATLTIGSSETTAIWNTALTADRAVTLSTSGAFSGAKFRIVRTASATGAFNLNVGTGPLKAMGTAGSFCDVEYNGTAWMLTAYGTL